MVERVLDRIRAERVPVPVAEPPGARSWVRSLRRWARRFRRSLIAALCGLLTVLVLTPPVRAAVSEWFGFGGVEVRQDPSAVPSPGSTVPGCGPAVVSLVEAERRAGFKPLVPEALGTPDAVTVTREPKNRFLISLCWRERGRTIRLDEFPAQLSPGFTKFVPEPPEPVTLRGADGGSDEAYWIARPHNLRLWLMDSGGDFFVRAERPAESTLLWVHGSELTLRLEGVTSRERAVGIAESPLR
ncbi:hypothetical protein [Streptomyces cavernae]|uniref:hypothetical protein n=1 Tax=Streptomyces cavernae TaxID=2259034 RepID=UPI0030B8459B